MEQVMIHRRSHDLMESLTAEDFETASICSAAPSYRSEAPTLHYTVPNSGGSMLPPYTAPPAGSVERSIASAAAARHRSVPSLSAGAARAAASRRAASTSAASASASAHAFANPLLAPRGGGGGTGDAADLSHFRIPSWSTISSSPNARLYHSVALRRVAAAEHASAAAEIGGIMRRLAVLERMEQEEAAASRRMAAANASRSSAGANSSTTVDSNTDGAANSATFRPLEDPYLVGEAEARRARAARIASENQGHGVETLVREDRRWDWFLDQVRNRQVTGRGSSRSRLRRRRDAIMHAMPLVVRHAQSRRL